MTRNREARTRTRTGSRTVRTRASTLNSPRPCMLETGKIWESLLCNLIRRHSAPRGMSLQHALYSVDDILKGPKTYMGSLIIFADGP